MNQGGDIPSSDVPVVVYWRPGCGFCSSLLRRLDRARLTYDHVDIWQDGDAAAFVRAVAGGHETVPTVRIGDTALINPGPHDVLETVERVAPDRLPADYQPPRRGLVARLLTWLHGG